jgi:hypothetical protein
VVLFAYGPATAFAVWMHDLKSWKAKLAIVGGVYALAAISLIFLIGVLHWI